MRRRSCQRRRGPERVGDRPAEQGQVWFVRVPVACVRLARWCEDPRSIGAGTRVDRFVAVGTVRAVIQLDYRGPVALLTIDRPERRTPPHHAPPDQPPPPPPQTR